MATRQKTIRWYFSELAAVTDNTDTNFTQQTINIPDLVAFRSVMLNCTIQDAAITSNNVARKQLSMALGASAYTVLNNTNLQTSSGEQKWLHFSGDFTSLFTASWTGTSMTCDARVLVDSAAASPILRCATACLEINYDYDDTVVTQIKSVRIPLNAPITALTTTKPGTATDTIPNLDTYLPEASKVFRQYTIVMEGNEESAATTDHAPRWEVDTLGIYSPGTHEQALNTASWYRHTENQAFTTSATHSFFLWATTTDYDHPHVYLDITYEYNESTSTEIFNSLLIPYEFDGYLGTTSNTNYQRASADIYIEEPATIAIKASALMLSYEAGLPISGIQLRCNAGSWSGAYSSVATTVAGSCGMMLRCETNIALVRGKNTITFDGHSTVTTGVTGIGYAGLLILNYTSGKHSSGSGVHNKTVFQKLYDDTLTSASLSTRVISATSGPQIPETDYYINAAALFGYYIQNSTSIHDGFTMLMERLSAEGGVKFEILINRPASADNITGKRVLIACACRFLKRYPTDVSGIDIEGSRRYLFSAHSNTATAGWLMFGFWSTYHSMTWTVAGDITNSGGGTVTLKLFRASDGKLLKTTTRVGNGAYSFSWYDNIEDLYVDAWESNVLLGRSAVGPAV